MTVDEIKCMKNNRDLLVLNFLCKLAEFLFFKSTIRIFSLVAFTGENEGVVVLCWSM